VVLPKLTAPVMRRTALLCLAAGLWIADGINVALVSFVVGQGAKPSSGSSSSQPCCWHQRTKLHRAA
jgi:hypothetical protein